MAARARPSPGQQRAPRGARTPGPDDGMAGRDRATTRPYEEEIMAWKPESWRAWNPVSRGVLRRAFAATPVLATLLLADTQVISLTLSPTEVPSGTAVSGTVKVSFDALSLRGVSVALSSSDAGVATVPTSLSVSSRLATATFQVSTRAGAAGCPTISAQVGQTTARSALLYVQPSPRKGVLALGVSNNPVAGGSTITGHLTLFAVPSAKGTVVRLSSSSPHASVPASVTILPSSLTEVGTASASFPIHTTVVGAATCAVITANAGTARDQDRVLLKLVSIGG
jgi:hypothetical protein